MTNFHVIIRGESMWPTFSDGQKLVGSKLGKEVLTKGDIIVAKHPLKPKVTIVKRISEILETGQLFLQGDNPDPLASEDSHNFGPLNISLVIGIIKDQ